MIIAQVCLRLATIKGQHSCLPQKAQYLRFSFDSDFILLILSSFSWSNLTCFQWRFFLGAFECSCVCGGGGGGCTAGGTLCVCVAVILHHPLKPHTLSLTLPAVCVCVLTASTHLCGKSAAAASSDHASLSSNQMASPCVYTAWTTISAVGATQNQWPSKTGQMNQWSKISHRHFIIRVVQ